MCLCLYGVPEFVRAQRKKEREGGGGWRVEWGGVGGGRAGQIERKD